jgi:hypothetical protein
VGLRGVRHHLHLLLRIDDAEAVPARAQEEQPTAEPVRRFAR